MNERNFFTIGSPFLSHPLLTAARTQEEVDFVVNMLDLPLGARLLDVGCGFGRHALALAQRGYAVLGIDPAAAMIAAARERAAKAAVSAAFQQCHAEDFVTEKLFDGAICLFTSLGQVSARGENSGLVQRVYDALRPGARFVVEVPQRETAVRFLKPEDRFGEGERYTAVTRQYNPQNQMVTERFRVVTLGQTDLFKLQYRLYDRAELVMLMNQCGFKVQTVLGSYAGKPLTDEDAIMIFVVAK